MDCQLPSFLQDHFLHPCLLLKSRSLCQQQPGVKVESFRFEIDQTNFDCSAGTLNSGNKAPYAYNPSTNAFAGELQIHAAQCKTRF